MGCQENAFIPVSRVVTVSMSLADYEAEKRRCRDDGYKAGMLRGKRHVMCMLQMLKEGAYVPEVITQDDIPQDEFEKFMALAKEVYEEHNGK